MTIRRIGPTDEDFTWTTAPVLPEYAWEVEPDRAKERRGFPAVLLYRAAFYVFRHEAEAVAGFCLPAAVYSKWAAALERRHTLHLWADTIQVRIPRALIEARLLEAAT